MADLPLAMLILIFPKLFEICISLIIFIIILIFRKEIIKFLKQ